MGNDIVNLIKREVARAMASTQAHPRAGIVESYDPDTHSVKVKIQPDEYSTGWLPLATQNAGNGFGVLVGPEIGAQVVVAFLEGDTEAAVVLGRIYSDEDKPPPCPSGEVIIKNQKGAMITLDNSGVVTATSEGGMMIRLSNDRIDLGGTGGSKVVTEAGPSPYVFAKV